VLPFEPRDGAEIHTYAERQALEADWAAAMDDIENSDMMLNRQPDAPPEEEE
jgi:hypothetical protein